MVFNTSVGVGMTNASARAERETSGKEDVIVSIVLEVLACARGRMIARDSQLVPWNNRLESGKSSPISISETRLRFCGANIEPLKGKFEDLDVEDGNGP